ncbi:hypothetical protein [Caudoviricetes sp.]|nr:hypothetical protein [Caudoviricetes sp.]
MTNNESIIFTAVVWIGSFLAAPAVASVVWPVVAALGIAFAVLRWIYIGLDKLFGEE